MTSTLSIVKTLKSLSDSDLVLGLKSVEEPSSLARYQTEFWRRFAPYVFKVALQRCQGMADGESLAKDLTQVTFIKAFTAIQKFTIAIGDDAVFKKLVKGWLGKIANNNFNKLYALRKNEETDLGSLRAEEPSYDMFESLFEPDREEQPSGVTVLLRQAMAQLKDIDRHIIISYADEGCLDSTRHISDNTMHLLCETYKTTSENIRQRKNRALKKIKAYCMKN